jgi:hypothetical protein
MPTGSIFRGSYRILVLAMLFATSMIYYHLGLFVPKVLEVRASKGLGNGYSFGNDFYPIWLTSRDALLYHRNPYSGEMTREIQIGLFGRPIDGRNPSDPPPDYRAFAYPAFTDLLCWPLALLPFPVVRVGLAVVLAMLTATSIVLWLRALGFRAGPVSLAILILLTLSSYAVLEGLFAEQPGMLVGFLLAGSVAALVEGRLVSAGGLLAFSLIKPQISALVALYFLLWSFARWEERRRFARSFLLWSGLLVGSSLLVWPQWIPQWLHVLFGYKNYSTPPLLIDLLGSRIGSRLGPWLIATVLGMSIALAWRMRGVPASSGPFTMTISLLLALTSVALMPGHAVYDHVVLLPGIILTALRWRDLAQSSRVFRVVLAAGAVALFWQWIFALALIGMRPLLPSAKFYSVAVFALPIRTAGSIPFAVLALLGLMMREVMRHNLRQERTKSWEETGRNAT